MFNRSKKDRLIFIVVFILRWSRRKGGNLGMYKSYVSCLNFRRIPELKMPLGI